jgi:hypothetical protein
MGLHGFHLDVMLWDELNMKEKKELDNSTRAIVKKEMAKPRMAKSARIAELNLRATRISERLAAKGQMPH